MASAQVSSYTFSQSSGTYTPITGTVLDAATGNTSTTNLNSNIYPLSLPFGFVFNGVSYNSLNVSTNGFITFGSTAPSTTYTTPISGTTAYEGAVSVFGKDLSSFFDISGTTGISVGKPQVQHLTGRLSFNGKISDPTVVLPLLPYIPFHFRFV